MRENEFLEDRERQLPPDFNLLADVSEDGKAAEALKRAPMGEPPDEYTVRSVYDSRPVSTFDFNITPSAQELASTNTVDFQVPQGYVCVLRRVFHTINDPPGTNRANFLMTLMLNGAAFQYNRDIPVGFESDDLVRCFMVADEFDTVGVKLTCSSVSGTSILYVTFYGQFILKTGRPAPFEIANPVGLSKTSSIRNVAPDTLRATPAIPAMLGAPQMPVSSPITPAQLAPAIPSIPAPSNAPTTQSMQQTQAHTLTMRGIPPRYIVEMNHPNWKAMTRERKLEWLARRGLAGKVNV